MGDRYLGLTNVRTLCRHHADTERRAIEPGAGYAVLINGALKYATADSEGNLLLVVGGETVSIRVVGQIVAGDTAPDAALTLAA